MCKYELTPVWTEKELAKFNFETDVLEKMDKDIRISFIREYNGYVVTKRKDVVNNKVYLNTPCIFYNKELGKCSIEEYKPSSCKSNFAYDKKLEGSVIKYKLPVIRKFSNKHLKNMKEDMLLYLILNSFNNLRDNYPNNGYINFKYDFGLVITDENNKTSMSSVRYTIASTNVVELKPLTVVYNKLNRRFVLKSPTYIEILVNKLRRLMSGISFVEVDLDKDDFLTYLSSFLILLDLHKNRLKNKAVKGLISDTDFYITKKWMFNYAGVESLLYPSELIQNLYKNSEMIFKAIMKQK